jgi:hypothetical protein
MVSFSLFPFGGRTANDTVLTRSSMYAGLRVYAPVVWAYVIPAWYTDGRRSYIMRKIVGLWNARRVYSIAAISVSTEDGSLKYVTLSMNDIMIKRY